MLDHHSIFYGVRISKPDGDDAYRWWMTRPDAPYRPDPVRPQLEAGKGGMHQPIEDIPPEGDLVIQEVKEDGETTVEPVELTHVRIEELVVHVQGPTQQAFGYLVAIVDGDDIVRGREWAAVTRNTANTMIDDYEVKEKHIDVDTDDEVEQWVADLFTTIAFSELRSEGVETPWADTQLLSERANQLLSEHVELELKELQAAEDADIAAYEELLGIEDDFDQEELEAWAQDLASAFKPKRLHWGPLYWFLYFKIWLQVVLFGGLAKK